MWYLALYFIFAAWVFFDGFDRKLGMSAVIWALGTLFVGPIILPIYLARRPLKSNETREGGTAWNVLKNFAICWTIVMAVATVSALLAMGRVATALRSDAERAGAGIGLFVGFGLLMLLWVLPTLGTALLGFFLKKNNVIEQGPTGPLIGSHLTAGFLSGFAGLMLVAVGGSLVALSLRAAQHPSSSHSSLISTAIGSSSSQSESDKNVGWQVFETTDEMDGTRHATLRIDAENEVPGIIGRHRPYLAIQCHGGESQVVVNVGTPIQSEYGQYETFGIRIKFDTSAPARQRWTESTNHVALFSPTPVRLITQLLKTDVFLFEFTPFQQTADTVRFNVSGLPSRLKSVAAVCGVKL